MLSLIHIFAAHAGEHGLQHGHVLGGVDGEGGVVLIEQASACLLYTSSAPSRL